MDSATVEVTHDLTPFIRVYKDGRVERLMGTEIVPPSPIDPKTGVESKDIVIVREIGVSARLYKPKTMSQPTQKFPLLIYFHGGAFFVQTAFSPTYQYFLNSLVAEAKVIVVFVDYRRAPESPLPIGYEDSWAAVKWVASHSCGVGQEVWLKEHVDFDLVYFGGDSAGANIANNMAIRVGLEGLEGGKLVGVVMMHPYFWGKDPIGVEYTDTDRRGFVDKFWLMACPSSTGLDDPLINPAKDPNLPSLGSKRVLVFVAERDLLRDRGRFYYEVLGKSGWGGEVEIEESEGEDHVFHLEKPNCEKAKDIVKRVASFINQDKAKAHINLYM